jgi:hypothetical protein
MRRSEQNEERLMKRKLLLVLTAMAVLLGMISTPTFQSTAWADGTETLGVPTLAVQPTGSGIALSGNGHPSVALLVCSTPGQYQSEQYDYHQW